MNANKNGRYYLFTPQILVVDDVEESLDLMGRIIKRMNLAPILVSKGQEAIEIINVNNDIKLVIMDIQLADMSGITVAKKIRKIKMEHNGNSMPIIGISGFMEEELKKADCEGSIFDQYLTKPIDLDLFKATIEKLL